MRPVANGLALTNPGHGERSAAFAFQPGPVAPAIRCSALSAETLSQAPTVHCAVGARPIATAAAVSQTACGCCCCSARASHAHLLSYGGPSTSTAPSAPAALRLPRYQPTAASCCSCRVHSEDLRAVVKVAASQPATLGRRVPPSQPRLLLKTTSLLAKHSLRTRSARPAPTALAAPPVVL